MSKVHEFRNKVNAVLDKQVSIAWYAAPLFGTVAAVVVSSVVR